MSIIHIDSLSHPGVEIFTKVTDPQLRNKQNKEKVFSLQRVQK